MSGRDRRSGSADNQGGTAGGAPAAGKRTLTDVVQRSPLPGGDAPQLKPGEPAPGGGGPLPGASFLDEVGAAPVQMSAFEDFGKPRPKTGMDHLPENLRPRSPDRLSEEVEKFRDALGRGDREAALWAWGQIGKDERRRFAGSPSIESELDHIREVMGTTLIHIMEDLGLTFAGRADLLSKVLRERVPERDWMSALAAHPTLWSSFMDTLPARDAMTDDDARGLGTYINRTGSENAAKQLFARAYAPLRDDSYKPETLHTHAWKIEWIQRLYKVIVEHLPLGHVRTVADFSIGYEYKDKETDAKFQKLGHGWWNRKGRHIVLPESSAVDGKKTNHSMAGGKGHGEAINKHDVSVLHEVGHGVGQELGGNSWAEGYDVPGWKTSMDADTWSKGLWGDDDTLTAAAAEEVGDPGKVLPASEARLYLANAIAGTAYTVKSPKFRTTRDVESFIKKHYADEPLTDYRDRVAKVGREDAYKFKDHTNVSSDGRVYVYLTRSDNGFSSYTKAAFDQKVSWYSLSSVREWFAEQYANYYRTTPHGTGMEAGAKKKLDELHGAKYGGVPRDGLMKPDDANDSAAGEDDDNDRLPFPW